MQYLLYDDVYSVECFDDDYYYYYFDDDYTDDNEVMQSRHEIKVVRKHYVFLYPLLFQMMNLIDQKNYYNDDDDDDDDYRYDWLVNDCSDEN